LTKQTIEEVVAASASPADFEKTWLPVLSADGSPLAYGAKSYTRYRDSCGESLTIIEINANPAQIVALYTDVSTLGKQYTAFDVTAASLGVYGRFEQKTKGVVDRDSLTRSVITSHPDGSIMESARSITDARYVEGSERTKEFC
jgi:hypothetical protein